MDLRVLESLFRAQLDNSIASTTEYHNKGFLLKQHAELIESHNDNFTPGSLRFNLPSTVTPGLHSGARVELVASSRLTISTLVDAVDKVLNGKFLLCRVIAPALKLTSLQTVIDDPDGVSALRLSLYNYMAGVDYLPMSDTFAVLPVGTVLAVKNPWFKTTKDGGRTLRCDNPGDVVEMDASAVLHMDPSIKWAGMIPGEYSKYIPPVPETGEDWKRRGNEHFVGKRYSQAVYAYTKGLELQQQKDLEDLLSNRAAALLNMERYAEALVDTDQVLNMSRSPTHLKAIFRKARALWGLRKYDEAAEFLGNLEKEIRRGKLVKELQAKAKIMLAQSKRGDYPVVEVARSALMFTNTGSSLQWADYVGPVVVRDTEDGRGRGLYATEKILAGQLVLGSKAFAFVLKRQDDMTLKSGLGFLHATNLESGLSYDASQAELRSVIARKLRNNPELGKEVYSMYAGPDLGPLNPEDDAHDFSLVDMKRIDAICTYNAFGNPIGKRGRHEQAISDRFCGLWTAASYLNHSCVDCNCFWAVHEDFILVRAFRNIAVGEEVTTTYVTSSDSYVDRKRQLQSFGIECSCSLCVYERSEPRRVAKEIQTFLQRLENLEMVRGDAALEWFAPTEIRSALALIDRISKQRPEKHSLFLATHLDSLAGAYFQCGDFANAVRFLERSYRLLDASPARLNAFNAVRNLVAAYGMDGQREKCKEWFGVVKRMAVLCWGPAIVNHMEVIAPHMMGVLRMAGIV